MPIHAGGTTPIETALYPDVAMAELLQQGRGHQRPVLALPGAYS